MANVLLTETCVRSCPYCFAKQYMAETDEKDFLSWDNLIYITDFLAASGEKQISLLGGEPLLHPNIIEFIQYLNSRGFFVTVFTSGIMPEERFGYFEEKLLSFNRLHVSFVCNVNEPCNSPKAEIEKVKRFFSVFGNFTSLSFNIYRLDFQMEFLRNYILEYGLNRHIRLGLAHPIPGQKNLFINPTDFKIVKNKLMENFADFCKYDIEPGFDCGFPMCMFDDAELGTVFKYTHGRISFQCGPAIDIGIDLSVWSCFPLSGFHRKNLLDFSNYSEVIECYGKKIDKIRNEVRGLYLECDICKHFKTHLCSGGCLAHILNYFIKEGCIRNNNYESE